MKQIILMFIGWMLLNIYTPLYASPVIRGYEPVIRGNREWRQPALISANSYNDLAVLFDTSTGKLKDPTVFAPYNSGYPDFEGYTWASTADVIELVKSYGRGLETLNFNDTYNYAALSTTNSFSINAAILFMLKDFRYNYTDPLGSRVDCLNCAFILDGLTRDIFTTSPQTGAVLTLAAAVRISDQNRAPFNYSSVYAGPKYGLSQRTVAGAWMYRDIKTVPEPAPLALLGLGLVGFGIMRKRRR